ncbi:MAG: DUF3617 family protein [Deltaproteobacteria bacterium]|nr:DUF3617 family protein [Deltaproteobacteria bacterium]
MGKKAVLVIVLLVVFMMATMAIAGGPNMNPGKWEITTKVEMPGMPMKMPPITTTQCLTKDSYILKEPPKPGAAGEMKSPCKVTNSQVKGDTVIWDMVCEGQEGMTYHGELTYHGDTMEGFIKMVPKSQGEGNVPVTLRMKGKRVGPCD